MTQTTEDNGPLSVRAALSVSRQAVGRDAELRIGLACGFTPLHLGTLVEAYACTLQASARCLAITAGYGDLAASLTGLADELLDGVAVILDWADLDPRLSARRAAVPAAADDVISTTRSQLRRFHKRISALATQAPLVVIAPTLPFPPRFVTRHGQVSATEAAVRAEVASFIGKVAQISRVRIADGSAIPGGSTAYDLRMHLRADFPYSVEHASELARRLVGLLMAPQPKKGIITDLDDTLWRGLVGEIGPEAVSWDLDNGSQGHAMYQQLLRRLADSGVLIAVASKNETSVVQEALRRTDLIAPVEKLYPVIASWQPKSLTVAQILKAWNIGPSDVVVVDDNPLELSEISQAFPEIETLKFSPTDAGATLALIRQLDDLFARDSLEAEDALRVESLRAGAEYDRAQHEDDDYRNFLAEVKALIAIEFETAHSASRAYELVQKTNQFNLNGKRHTEGEWRRLGARPRAISAIVRYQDRFGDLGSISVLTGTIVGSTALVDSWVLSCRAFSRAVEHHTLAALVQAYGLTEVLFDFVETNRNRPIRDFLASMGVDIHDGPFTLSAQSILADESATIHQMSIEPHTGAKASN